MGRGQKIPATEIVDIIIFALFLIGGITMAIYSISEIAGMVK